MTRQIKTSLRRHRLPSDFLFLFLFALIIASVAALLGGFGLVAGLVVGLVIGLVMGLLITTTSEYSATEPREIIRNEFMSLLLVILLLGLLGGLVTELTGGRFGGLVTELTGGRLAGFVAGLVVGLRAGFVAGLMIATTALRYFVFLLCTRRWTVHWLPWRLGKFLHWCYQAGLLRTAGVGYQFRHKELQDYLAVTRPPRTRLRWKPAPHLGFGTKRPTQANRAQETPGE